jgi:hypothetical protein
MARLWICAGIVTILFAASWFPDLVEGADGTNCQWHALVPIDCEWMHGGPGPMPPPKYSDADLLRFVKDCKAVGGAVTLNVGIYQEGHMAKASVAQLGRLAAELKAR